MTDHDFGFRTDFYTFSPEALANELPEYEIVREVGKGSMGIVYEAIRRADAMRVAIKVVPPSLTLTDRALARFVKEGEVMSRVEHPSIVRVYEHGEEGRLHYFVMEFVDGITLEKRLETGPLPARDAASLCEQAAGALQFAHDRGIVHRDVKPGNIILAEDGRVVVTDFGLARETGTGSFTESGAIVGTPMYMAPEQILGHRSDVDSRADVYGLGATLFEALTGHPPFSAPTAQGVLQAVLDQEPPRPARFRADLPAALEAITLRALEKRPGMRYGSAREMADDLRRFLNGDRVHARLPTAAGRVLRIARSRPLLSTLVLIIVVLLAGAAFLYVERQNQRNRQRLESARLQITKATSRQVYGFRPARPAEKRTYLEKARRLATEVLREDESNFDAWLLRGQVHYHLEEWQDALDDLDRAESTLGAAREDILTMRIRCLHELRTRESQARLMQDLKSLLELDQSDANLYTVADYMLRFAAAIPDAAERESVLVRVDSMLDRIREATGPKAVARAQVLQLRNQKDAALAAAAKACLEFSGDPLVHDEAARIYRAFDRLEDARAEASMARLLRGEDRSEELPSPRVGRDASLDTRGLENWLSDLGRLFDPPKRAAK